MVGLSIPGPTDPVIITTVGLFVVPDTSLSQPLSALEPPPTYALVMSELRCATISFTVPFMHGNSLHPSCNDDVPAYTNVELDHIRLCHAPVGTLLWFLAFE